MDILSCEPVTVQTVWLLYNRKFHLWEVSIEYDESSWILSVQVKKQNMIFESKSKTELNW